MNRRNMRRHERALGEADCKRIIKSCEYGVLSLCDNGKPYGVPLSPAYDEANNKLYFHCAWEGYKIDILNKNDAGSFLFVGKAENMPEKATVHYESVMCFGSLYMVEDEAERMRAFELICHRYMRGHEEAIQSHMKAAKHAAIVGFDIQYTSGKHNS